MPNPVLDEIFEYDKSILNEWSIEIDDNKVPIRFAEPHHAFSTILRHWENKAGRKIELPVITLQRSPEIVFDPTRHIPNENLCVSVPDPVVRDEVLVTNSPQAVNLGYIVNFWGVEQRQANIFLKIAMLKFTDSVGYVSVALGDLGTHSIPIVLGSIDDTSDLEPGTSDIKVRKTASFELQGWLFRPRVLKKTFIFDGTEIDSELV